jgi:hypothetical protein
VQSISVRSRSELHNGRQHPLQAAAPNGASGKIELTVEFQPLASFLLATTSATKSARSRHPGRAYPRS